MKKLNHRDLTQEEKIKIANLLLEDNGGVTDVTMDEIIQELDNSTILAFDTPDGNVYVTRIVFTKDTRFEDMSIEKYVEEYLISEDKVEFAGEIDVIQ